MALHDAYSAKMDAQLNEWTAKLDAFQAKLTEWRAKADQLEAGARAGYYEQIHDLEAKIAAVRAKIEAGQRERERLKQATSAAMGDLKSGASTAWEDFKAGAESAWTDVKSAFDRATTKLDKGTRSKGTPSDKREGGR